MKKVISIIAFTMLIAVSAWASVGVQDDGVAIGTATDINFVGATVTGTSVMAVSYTAPDITGGTINGAVIGGVTPAAGTFTALTSTGATIIGDAAADTLHVNANTITFEGATADAFETTLAITDPTADQTLTVPNGSGAVVISSLTTNNFDAANSVTGASNALVFEGATADAFEASIVPVDPTADMTVSLPNFAVSYAVLGSTLTSNNIDGANSVWAVSNGVVLEGATADAFETTVSPVDPTADQTVSLPNFAVNYAVLGSTLTTNNIETANSIWAASNSLVLECLTADAFETTIAPADATADQTITIPNNAANSSFVTSSLTTNAVDAANSVTLTSNGFIAEGATADTSETTVAFTDPTADQTVTVPNTAGAEGTVQLNGVTVVITAGASPTLTVPVGVDFIATDTITTDNQDQTITFSSGGTVGQKCFLLFQTDSGGSGDEVITFHTTLTNTEGTLTLANLTAGRYVVVLQSDGTVFNEISRTAALS